MTQQQQKWVLVSDEEAKAALGALEAQVENLYDDVYEVDFMTPATTNEAVWRAKFMAERNVQIQHVNSVIRKLRVITN